jgi:glucosamine 6-phosphate synthetase-like amidotransferase/phosphosugar isomerase protein
MCGLFGIHYYGKEKNRFGRLLELLGNASAERGTDATGFAYVKNGKIKVIKHNVPAWQIDFTVPTGIHTIVGHTRKATVGSPKIKENNHPILGKAGDKEFALTHNGTIENIDLLEEEFGQNNFSSSQIMCDSHLAVRAIEIQNDISVDSIKYMLQKIEGDYAFSVLDNENNLYLAKRGKPLVLMHLEEFKMYMYASTEEILMKALIDYYPTREAIMSHFRYSVFAEWTNKKHASIQIKEFTDEVDLIKISKDKLEYFI